MPRKKVTLAFIENDMERKASYNMRTKGFLKKAEELSKLCGIYVFAILYGPLSAEPVVYSSTDEIQSLISRFKNLTDLQQTKKMVNHETFIENRVMKAQTKLKNQQKNNKKKELTHYINQCLADDQRLQSFGLKDLVDMDLIIDQKLKEITRKMEILKKNQQLGDQPSNEGDNLTLSLAITSYGEENKKDSMVAPKLPKNKKRIVKKLQINTDKAGPSNS